MVKLNRQGNRKYYIDNTLFEKIDCEWKAYFLGYMYADGHIYGHLQRCSLCLSEKDKGILDKFNELIYHSKKPLMRRSGKTIKFRNGIYTTKPSFCLVINSVKIVADLVSLGCLVQKSLILKFPTDKQVPSYLMPHFLRGYFDGDGSVAKQTKGIRSVAKGYVLGSKSFILSFHKYLEKLGITSRPKPYGKIYWLDFSGFETLAKLRNLFYSNCNICLERKKKNFDDIYNNFFKSNLGTGFKGINYIDGHYIVRLKRLGKELIGGSFKEVGAAQAFLKTKIDELTTVTL